MSSLIIYANDLILDLYGNSAKEFFINKTLHDINNLETRDGDNSKNITIPRTDKNVSILKELLPSFDHTYNYKDKTLSCKVLINGITIIEDGILHVLGDSVYNNNINIFIVGGIARFYDTLKTTSIRNLNFSDENLNWSLTYLKPSVNKTSGFLFAKTQYFTDNTIRSIVENKRDFDVPYWEMEIDECGGWFYIKDIVKRIFGQNEKYEIDTTVFDEVPYRDMILSLPITQKFDSYNSTENVVRGAVSHNITEYYDRGTSKIKFDTVDVNDPIDFWDTTNKKYVLPYDSYIHLDLIIDYHIDSVGVHIQGQANYVILNKNGQEYRKRKIVDFGTLSIKLDEYATINDTYEVFIEVATGYRVELWRYWSHFKIKSQNSTRGKYVNIPDYFPDISEKNFIKEMFKFTHLIPRVENDRVTFVKWDKIIFSEQQLISNKINLRKGFFEEKCLKGYSKDNLFTYNENSLVLKKEKAHIYQNCNLATDNKTALKINFNVCDKNTISFNEKYVQAPIFDAEFEVDDGILGYFHAHNMFCAYENVVKVGDIIYCRNESEDENYIGKIVSETDSKHWNMDVFVQYDINGAPFGIKRIKKTGLNNQIAIAKNGNSNIILRDGTHKQTVTPYKDAIFDDILTIESIIYNYYRNLEETIKNPIVLHLWINISSYEFSKIDITKAMYLEVENKGVYYINKMSQYKVDGNVRLELVKLKESER